MDNDSFSIDGPCWKFLPVTSEGFWNMNPGDSFITEHPLLLLQIQIASIFIVTTILHSILRRFHLPRFVSEFLAGLILGHSFLGKFYPEITQSLFPPSSLKPLRTLVKFGYMLFMFMMGVKTDPTLLMKAGKREWTVGSLACIFPSIVLGGIAKSISVRLDHTPANQETWVLIASGTLMMTSYPMVACFLMDHKMINSELGHVALSTALVSDSVSLVLFNLESWVHLLQIASLHTAVKAIVLSIALIVFIICVLRPMMFWMIRSTPEGKLVKDSYVTIMFLVLLMVGIVGDNIGLQFLYGPYLLGMAVPTGPPLASVLVDKLDGFISGLAIPLLTSLCAYKADIWELKSMPPLYLLYVGTFGYAAKVIVSFVTAIYFKMPHKDAAALALLLMVKGVVELAVLLTSSEKTLELKDQYTAAALLIFIVSVVIPLLVRRLHDPSRTYAGYSKRTVADSSFSEGLRVLACAQRRDDALAAIKVLGICSPPKETPVSVFGLYLEDLKGGTTPVLLNHQLGQKKSSRKGGARWQPIIDVFTYFKSQFKKQADVQVFTAITPAKLMHEDICWVSFANSVVMMILPFHRKWDIRGQMIGDCKHSRALNRNVLNNAPCSVGILIDRSRSRFPSMLTSLPSYSVAVIYIGGNDDREVLALAQRMKECPNVHIKIFRLLAFDGSVPNSWDIMLDNEALRKFKHEGAQTETDNISYQEVTVEDGVFTAMFVMSVLENESFDLILVGKRHEGCSVTAGLSNEWSEFPELGPIGDLLVSSDIDSTSSVLVVQQQIIQD